MVVIPAPTAAATVSVKAILITSRGIDIANYFLASSAWELKYTADARGDRPASLLGWAFCRVTASAHTVRMTEDWGTATWRYWQKIGNEETARPSFRDQPPVPVRARIEWERDGEEWVDGTAERLGFDGAIFIAIRDRRCSTIGAWLRPDDVWWEGK